MKFVQTEAEKLSSYTPYPDPVLAVEAEQQPQNHPQYLPQDEICSDETYAESLPQLSQATLSQLDGHNDSDVLNHSGINVTEFLDLIKGQEKDRRRDAENARHERDEDLRNLRRMLDLPHE